MESTLFPESGPERMESKAVALFYEHVERFTAFVEKQLYASDIFNDYREKTKDIIADAREKIIENFHKFDPTLASFYTWGGRIVRNAMISAIRENDREAVAHRYAFARVHNEELQPPAELVNLLAISPEVIELSGGNTPSEVADKLNVHVDIVRARKEKFRMLTDLMYEND